MVATVTSNSKLPTSNPKRTALLHSEPENGTLRQPKAREVTSRFLSVSISSSSNSSSASSSTSTASSSITTGSLMAISSKRYQSPVVNRVGEMTPRNTERAVSVDRRRPAVVEATLSNSERMLVKSMRSLSLSFKGEPILDHVSKAKTAGGVGTPSGGFRKGTPERRKLTPVRDQRERENSRSSEQQQQQHRWPGRLRRDNLSFSTQSLDYGSERTKLCGSGTAMKESRKSMTDGNSRNKFGVTLKPENYKSDVKMTNTMEIGSNVAILVNSDTETVSLETIETGIVAQLRGVQRGILVPARVWKESNTIHKVLDPYLARSKMSGWNRKTGPSKLIGAKKVVIEGPVSFPGGLSPLKGGTRPASPSKLSMMTSTPLRGIDSPLKIRNGAGNVPRDNNASSFLSMTSFVTDVRRGNLGESRIIEAHDLRLLDNRQLQWRLVNARAEKSLLVQQKMAERSLYNAWISTTKLRDSVKSKRIELQLLRHSLMLYSILRGQESYLEKWDLIDVNHSNAVSGAKEALESSIIHLPIVCGARANVQNVEEAISSAVDVMQTMASSICSLITKVEQMNFLVCELANLSAREHSLLDECKDSLSTRVLPLQVMHCSQRIQLLQLQRVHTSSGSAKAL